MTQQLSYAIADGVAGRGRGGWGVVETSAGLSPDVHDALVRGRIVSMPAYVTQFMSDAQLAERPVRLRVSPWGDGCMIWHSVEAGTDSTGRPGNVFTHAALLPLQAPTRAMDWAYSPDWLRPFGAAQVAAAHLPQDMALPPMQLPFLMWLHGASALPQQRVTAALCAALEQLVRQAQVVFVIPGWQDASGLLDYLSWLLPFGVARKLSWATHEDARSATELLNLGFDVVCVERADHVQHRQLHRTPVVLDLTADLPSAGGDRWTTVLDRLQQLDPGALRAKLVERDELATAHLLNAYEALACALGLQDIPANWSAAAAAMPAAPTTDFDKMFRPTDPSDQPPRVASAPVSLDAGSPSVAPRVAPQGGSDSWAAPASPGPTDPRAPAVANLAPPDQRRDQSEPPWFEQLRPTGTFATMDDSDKTEELHLGGAAPADAASALSLEPRGATARSHAQPDPLDEFQMPSPASIIAAMRVLAGSTIDYHDLMTGDDWLHQLGQLDDIALLAVLHIATQDHAVHWPLRPTREFANAALQRRAAERLVAPVLLACARAEVGVDDRLFEPWAGAGIGRLAQELVGYQGTDLEPIAFQFSELRDRLDQLSGQPSDIVWLSVAHQQLPDGSVWKLLTGDGVPLCHAVLVLGRGLR